MFQKNPSLRRHVLGGTQTKYLFCTLNSAFQFALKGATSVLTQRAGSSLRVALLRHL